MLGFAAKAMITDPIFEPIQGVTTRRPNGGGVIL